MSSPALLKALDAGLRRLGRPLLLALGLACVVVLALFDAAGHHSLPLEAFYVAPVIAVAWLTDSTIYGLAVALAAALMRPAEALALAAPPLGPHPIALLAIGALGQFLLYLLVLTLLASVRQNLKRRETEALRDSLTGIANQRAFAATAEAELERSRRYRHQISLLYLDVDDFKAVNDRCGHGEGNRLLRRLVAVICASLRTVDTAARLGGDEFAILMPETGSRAAGQLAERLMAALEDETTSDKAPLTCSLGLVTFRFPPASVDALLEAGDRLMYEAKAAGKNRLRQAVLPADSANSNAAKGRWVAALVEEPQGY
jgi:diguanylate cyclase (GGDEF)-like protein